MASVTEMSQGRLEDAMLVVSMTWVRPGLVDEAAAWESLHRAIDVAMAHGAIAGALAALRGAAERTDCPLSLEMREAALRACEYVTAYEGDKED